jgi:small neutral amino acid transporter SnatA (MarC family)
MMNYTFLSATILLLLITDPIGNIPVFANALKHVPPERRAKVILREILIAFGLLLTFMFVGEGFLRVMNLSELSLQIGGGVILFLIALRMVFPSHGVEVDDSLRSPSNTRLSWSFGFGNRAAFGISAARQAHGVDWCTLRHNDHQRSGAGFS